MRHVNPVRPSPPSGKRRALPAELPELPALFVLEPGMALAARTVASWKPITTLQVLGGLERRAHHRAVGDEREVRAFPRDAAEASARSAELLAAALSAAVRNALLYRSLLESIDEVAEARRAARR